LLGQVRAFLKLSFRGVIPRERVLKAASVVRSYLSTRESKGALLSGYEPVTHHPDFLYSLFFNQA